MSARDVVARMLTLVPWLLERPGATVDETAAAFGVDRRTVLRDLDTIGYCGLPGLGGGDLFEVWVAEDTIVVRMADELREPLRLSPGEVLRLVAAGEAAESALGSDLPALRSALDKVRAAASMPAGVAVEFADEGTRWLPPLRDAIDRDRQVELRYRGRGDDAPALRQVEPWGLLVAHGAWYLQAHDAAAAGARTFRLDRIAEVRTIDEPRRLPVEVPGPLPRYERAPGDIDVELVVPRRARWLADEVVVDEVDDVDGSRTRIRFATDALAWVCRLILSAEGPIEVVRPAELAALVRAEASRALARYGP